MINLFEQICVLNSDFGFFLTHWIATRAYTLPEICFSTVVEYCASFQAVDQSEQWVELH